MPLDIPLPLQRWRLLLGEAAHNACGALDASAQAADAALEWLYGRDDGSGEGRSQRGERSAGAGATQLTVPDWINTVHQLFPQEVIERLERDAVERYGIDEIVTNLAVLERIEPSESLLRAVLQTKHLMNPEVLAAARKLVAEVVRRIMEQLATEVRQAFSGTRDRRRRSRTAIARNFDFKNTIAHNLHRWHPERQRLYLETPLFNSRTRRHSQPWDIILLVDQSGSMVDSVIHSAVMAACLWQLPGMRTRRGRFDPRCHRSGGTAHESATGRRHRYCPRRGLGASTHQPADHQHRDGGERFLRKRQRRRTGRACQSLD